MQRHVRLWMLAAAALLLAPEVASAQERRVTGLVTRQGAGTPLEGVEVSVVGPTRGQSVRTGTDGRYVVTAPTGDVRLQVRAIGYKRVEFTVPAAQSTADFALAQDIFNLSEVVVSGQATTIERRSATTSVSLVTGDELKKVPVPTVEAALTGKITGVNLQTNSGAPGGGIQMQIRGNNTVLGGFDPLFVVDGVIYSNSTIPSGRGFTNNAADVAREADGVNRLADLNPNDIASIEVLKGASASSIYGSKASNGVVVITTTRGQTGAPRVNVTQRLGQFSPLRLMEHRRWTQDSAVARYGQGVAPLFSGSASPFFDNAAEVYGQRDLSYETVLDVSGGNENTRYFVSGNWKEDKGIELNTGAGKQGLRVNVDQRLSPATDLRVSTVYSRNTNERGWNNNCNNYGCHGYALTYIPSFIDLTKRNPDGTLNPVGIGNAANSNPFQLASLGVNGEETNRFTGGVTLGWTPTISEGQTLRLVASGGLDAFDQRNDVWTSNELFFERVQPLPGESVESGGRSKFFNYNLNAVHTGDFFGVNATTSVGLQYEDRLLNTFRIRTQNLLPGQRNVNQGTLPTVNEELTQERTIAFYASEEMRLLNERLLVRGGLRAERSSVMGDINKVYIFPNVSGSYRFENLFGQGSEMKLRAAYGETGNQPLFGQKFTNLLTPQLGGQQGVAVSTAAGFPGVEPERLKEIEAGAEGWFLNERFTWELTYFNRNTTNLLLQRVPEPSSGFASQVFNGGKIRNWGVEAGIGFTPIQTASMLWVSRTTFTAYDSEVADLAGLPAFFPAASGFGNLGRTRVEKGKQITQIVGFGLDAQGNRNAVLSQLGNSAPSFRMGFANDFSWKRITLNAIVDWQQGGNVINLTEYLQDDGRTSKDWGSPEWAKRYNGYLKGAISPYIEDASFVKVREVSLNYDVPQSVTGIVRGLRTARVGLAGRNLLMFAPYRGLDPEVANFGSAAIRNNLDIAPYPPTRNILLNVTLGF
ncbi:MAG: SusC/RagA family TonB-linked outer membrane protein [Gemmatimonadaceae bacterium]|nr:SusC/RagA family TonB-linked outer membrane protein [Gemmatimonadaceae bacterium]